MLMNLFYTHNLGIDIHDRTVYVGSVGSKGGSPDITVLGDPANTAARQASEVKTGEILVSEAAHRVTILEMKSLEVRHQLIFRAPFSKYLSVECQI